MVDFVPPPVWPTDDVGPRHAVTRYATFDGHPCEGFFVNELGHMKCGTSATAGNPPYDCFPKRAPRVIFADCRYQGEFVTHSVELPLSWWPS